MCWKGLGQTYPSANQSANPAGCPHEVEATGFHVGPEVGMLGQRYRRARAAIILEAQIVLDANTDGDRDQKAKLNIHSPAILAHTSLGCSMPLLYFHGPTLRFDMCQYHAPCVEP